MNSNEFDLLKKIFNGLKTLRWLIFEPILLENYSKTLNKKQIFFVFLNTYIWITSSVLIFYIVIASITAILNIPAHYPNYYNTITLIESWNKQKGFIIDNTLLYFFTFLPKVIFGLAFGFISGLISSLLFNLLFGLIICLSISLAYSLIFGSVYGLALGLSAGLVGSLSTNQIYGLTFGLIFGLALNWIYGFALGLAFCLGWYLSYFRLYFYPYHFIKSLFYYKLDKNVYLKDGVIWLPIWGLKKKLCEDAYQRPEIAKQLVNFLLEYRPLQHQLAMDILHAATAGEWKANVLSLNYFNAPIISEKQKKKYQPSDKFLNLLDIIKDNFQSSETQNQAWLRQQTFEECYNNLKQLREQILRESPRWNFHYLPAIDAWIERAEEKLEELTQKAQQIEPLEKNCYILEVPLKPDQNRDVFMGRQAAKDRLAQEILTNQQMPLFLLQGQRRIGKTSLLKFLEILLPSGFKIVYQDCQSSFVNDDNPDKIIPKWFGDLYNKINHKLNISAEAWEIKESWSESWQVLEQHLLEIVKNNRFKIILAFDEYETLHNGLKSNPDKADVLLGAMRSFLQHQNQVAFLFTGAAFLDELTQPAWNSYFPQRVLLDIDYLSFDESKKLILLPKSLEYPDEIIEKMFKLTQGHPALLQALCKSMVDIANAQNKPLFSIKDLEEATQQVLEQYSGAIAVFWDQFCETEDYREIVRKILEKQPLDSNPILKRLLKHRYIISVDKNYRFRVPLFELWLKERF